MDYRHLSNNAKLKKTTLMHMRTHTLTHTYEERDGGLKKGNLANGLMVHKSHDGWQAWKQQQEGECGRRVSAFFFWLYIPKKIKLKLKFLKSSAF
jgi:hypothetical protein